MCPRIWFSSLFYSVDSFFCTYKFPCPSPTWIYSLSRFGLPRNNHQAAYCSLSTTLQQFISFQERSSYLKNLMQHASFVTLFSSSTSAYLTLSLPSIHITQTFYISLSWIVFIVNSSLLEWQLFYSMPFWHHL